MPRGAIRDLNSAGVILFLGFFPALSANLIQIKAQTISSPIKVSLIFLLDPVFAAIFTCTVGKEVFQPLNALNGFLIILSVIISTVQSADIDKIP